MLKTFVLLLLLSCAHAHAYPASCLAQVKIKMEILKSKNLGLSQSVEDSIADNIYYFCDLKLRDVESWACMNRSFIRQDSKSDVIHIGPQYKIWFEGVNEEGVSPEVFAYQEDPQNGTHRLNTYILNNDFKLMLRGSSPINFRMYGMTVDNRQGRDRAFHNVECFDVRGLTNY